CLRESIKIEIIISCEEIFNDLEVEKEDIDLNGIKNIIEEWFITNNRFI
ncbi:hypothetical protein OMAG_002562, partial [Candidatus Omnitrophus magneticus]